MSEVAPSAYATIPQNARRAAGIRYEIDPDVLEYARREAASGGIPGGEQAELPWDA